MVDEAVPAGFEACFRRVYPQARSVALRITGSMPEAEDAAAEAFARALVDWRRVGDLPHLDAWLVRVTTNAALDAVRRRRRPASALAPDATEDDAALRMTMVAALAALPRRQREAIVLRHMAGYSERDVAAALGVSTNTVKKHLQRGMEHLRRSFGVAEGASLAFD